MKKFRFIVLAFLFTLVSLAATIDTSGALYTSLFTLSNQDADATNTLAFFPVSGQTLSDNGFVSSDTLDTVVAENTTTSIPSQPPSLRQVMQSAQADDGGAFTDETTESNNDTPDDMTLLPATVAANDAYYFGGDFPFRILTVNVSQAGSGDWAGTWEYWNGSAWQGFSSVDDRSDGFKNGGIRTISWDIPTNWAIATVNSVDSYYARFIVDSVTTTVTQPLGQQSWWETGYWITYVSSIDQNEQVQYTSYFGGTDFVSNHQFFPGSDGYIVADNPSLENATNYLIRIQGYFETDGTASGYYLNKTDAIRIYNSADGDISAELNAAATTLTVSGIVDGEYIIDLFDNGSTVTLTVYGVGSDSDTSVSITDNTNDWEFGTDDSTLYFNEIFIGNPLAFLDTTTAEWDARTNTETDGVSDELVLTAADAFQTTCNGTQITPSPWEAICVSGSPTLGWANGSVTIPGTAQDGSNVYGTKSSGSSNVTMYVYQEIAATEGLDYSFAIWCVAGTGGDITSIEIEFREGTNILSTSTNSGFLCNSSWHEESLDAQTAPATTDNVRFKIGSGTSASSTTKGKITYWDNARACEDCSAAPVLQSDSSNLIGNGSFEEVYSTSGTSVSTAMDVTSITSYISSSVSWSETVSSGQTATIEFSTDNGSNWEEIETNGNPIPGITSGDDLSGASNYLTRITLTTSTGDSSPSIQDISVIIFGTGAALDGWWSPTEFIGLTLTDRSANTNTATTSFPVPTEFTTSVDALVPTGNIAVVSGENESPEVIGDISPGDEIIDPSGVSLPVGFPLRDLFISFSNLADIPVIMPVVWASLLYITYVGLLAYSTTGSVAASTFLMIIATLGVTGSVAGILPVWVLLFFAIGATGMLIYTRLGSIGI